MPGSDAASTPPLIVSLPDGRELRFSNSFYIGRDPSCEVQLADSQVSRRHAEVYRAQDRWLIRDLQSSNGLFVNGARVADSPIEAGAAVQLGAGGPTLQIRSEARQVSSTLTREAGPSESIDEYAQRYFGSGEDDENVGGRTLMIRKAYQRIQAEQRKRHRWTIALAAIVALAIGGYALYEHRQVSELEQHAQDTFYQMKALEVSTTQLQQRAAAAGAVLPSQEVADYNAQRQQMETNYEQYAERLYDRHLDEKDRLILRVTRMFGECELAAPPGYMREVKRYIQQWQQSGRFARDLKVAQALGYTRPIVDTFRAQGLPPQYFYLGMQESNFDRFAVGPATHWGFAKGMWQFIPETGRNYGLKIGPLFQVPRPDLQDDRFDWNKATVAAAKYVKDIYSTDAQASGLLVIASYNWGEQRVIDLVRTLPPDPRDRNFWQLLAKYGNRLPQQTYDYVFNIVSAAVIGENPRLFGFDFDNPLAFAETH
jgi:membrane-bound lytic murein transglycosylase D